MDEKRLLDYSYLISILARGGKMKNLSLGLILWVVTLGAVEIQDRIGMGLGFSPDTYLESARLGLPLPIVDIAVTKIGLNPKLAIEPIFQFTLRGDGATTHTTFLLSFLGDILLKGHEKTNLYARAGLGFMLDSPGGGAETEFGFNLPFGFGLEHFASEHFSINLSALSGFTFISNPPGGDSYLEIKLGNAKPFAFYLLWYY